MAKHGLAHTRPDGTPFSRHERIRQNIQTGVIIDRLQKCARGEIEMTSVQLQAAKFLINKTLPDMPAPKDIDPLNGAKDITHANPRALLEVIEGRAERKE